jgi:hypothetical protein
MLHAQSSRNLYLCQTGHNLIQGSAKIVLLTVGQSPKVFQTGQTATARLVSMTWDDLGLRP